MLNCCSHVANIVGPKIVVLEGHVGSPSIPGSCMRLDVSPALMFSCQLSKLIKKHLIVCHKRRMFDDGAICLCKSVRGSLYHLFQGVIPISFFPFLGCGVLPDDAGQRDTGYPITLVEEFINSIIGLWPISLWGDHPRYQCLGPPPLPYNTCGRIHQFHQRSLANLSHWGGHPRYPCLGPPPLPLQHMHCTQGLENCSHACLHHFINSLYLGFLPALGKIYNPLAQEVQVHFGVPCWPSHERFGPESVFHTLRLLLLQGNFGFLGDIGWSLPKYHSHDSPVFKTLGSQLILVSICPSIIPRTPQYSYAIG